MRGGRMQNQAQRQSPMASVSQTEGSEQRSQVSRLATHRTTKPPRSLLTPSESEMTSRKTRTHTILSAKHHDACSSFGTTSVWGYLISRKGLMPNSSLLRDSYVMKFESTNNTRLVHSIHIRAVSHYIVQDLSKHIFTIQLFSRNLRRISVSKIFLGSIYPGMRPKKDLKGAGLQHNYGQSREPAPHEGRGWA